MPIHWPSNTDNQARLRSILTGLAGIKETIIFPVHPRTQAALEKLAWTPPPHIRLIPPAAYLDMCALEANARVILPDSGGVQKEAYWLGVPCITLRDETEWVETVETGWNQLVGSDSERIRKAVAECGTPKEHLNLYDTLGSGQRIAGLVFSEQSREKRD